MNRIILVGNGFDKAHGMATGYRDFIDNYWNKVAVQIFSKYKEVILEEYNLLVRLDTYEDTFIKAYTSPSETDEWRNRTGLSRRRFI
ncbi:MAG: AbiH family protein [Alistipes indistinctus]